METLQAHEDRCVGMAANMIGVFKRIIAFVDIDTGSHWVMLNPEIIKTSKLIRRKNNVCPSAEFAKQDAIAVSRYDIKMNI